MNQAQHIANLYLYGAQAKASLQQGSRRGSISLDTRYGAIYALDGFSTALVNEQALNANLQAQITLDQNRIAQLKKQVNKLNAEIIRLAAEGKAKNRVIATLKADQQTAEDLVDHVVTQASTYVEDATARCEELEKEDFAATESFESAKEQMEKDRQSLIETCSGALVALHNKYTAELADARAELAVAKETSKNAIRILIQLLDFAKAERNSITGWLLNRHQIVDPTFHEKIVVLADIVHALGTDIELADGDLIMQVVDGLEKSGI